MNRPPLLHLLLRCLRLSRPNRGGTPLRTKKSGGAASLATLSSEASVNPAEYVSPAGLVYQASVTAALTAREREVAAQLMQGLTSKEIGRALGISHRTVEIYRARLMRKYRASTAAELVQKLMSGR